MSEMNTILTQEQRGLVEGQSLEQLLRWKAETPKEGWDDLFETAFQYGLKLASDRLTAKLAEAEAERDCATETLEAWFNTKSFATDNIDPRVLDAAEGYLRVSRIGGMENAESDMVKGVIQDMAYKGVFSQVFTEYTKARERDAYQRGFKAAQEDVDRLRYVLQGTRDAIKTGRHEPLMIWRDQIEIALEATAKAIPLPNMKGDDI